MMIHDKRKNARPWFTGAVALLAMLVVAGCGDDDNGGTSSKYAGQYSGSGMLESGQQADIQFTVGSDGKSTGTLRLAAARSVRRVALPASPVALSGFTEADGHFDLSGTFKDSSNQDIAVHITGALPTPTSSGTMTIQIGSQTFSGAFTPPPPTATIPVATATRTTAVNPTATRTSAATNSPAGATNTPTATPSPTNTPRAGEPTATATSGVVNGVDTRLLGTWSGEAKNETTGVHKQVRIRIALQGTSVVVTDLGGNLFKSGSANPVTMTTPTATSLVYTNSTGSPLIAFNLTYIAGDSMAGLYQLTTVAVPPIVDGLGLDLHKEG